MWAVIPIFNTFLFRSASIYSLHEEGEQGLSLRELCTSKIFWMLMLMMTCAGASEQAVSQWASTFAETSLHISKTLGDLAGPLTFAACMGASRLLYGKYGDRIRLDLFMRGSCILCILSYLCISILPFPALNLFGCALCGFSVGIMWPGLFSTASVSIPRGGTTMFALLALAGDLGCSGGPTLAGLVSSYAGGSLKTGIFAAITFPAVLLLGLIKSKKSE